jgi:hypothetical protein
MTCPFRGNTKPTQLGAPGKINTEITRTKRHCPARLLAWPCKPMEALMQVKRADNFSGACDSGYDRPSVNRQVIGSSPIAGARHMAFDLRFLLIRDCLRDSLARRSLCWLVLIMAVRGSREDRGAGLRRSQVSMLAHQEVCGRR